MIKKIITYTSLFAFIIGCSISSNTALVKKQNNNYKKDANTIHPQFSIFNTNDSITELHFKISSKELLYTRPDGINFFSNVLISYRLLPSYDSKEIIDSSSTRLVDANNALEEKFLIGKINVKAKAHKNYFIKITVTDVNKNISVASVIAIDKSNDLNRQNFIVKSKSSDTPVFGNLVKTSQELIIQYKSKIGVSLFVRYYKRNFPLAAPPFSLTESKTFQYQPDSTYVLQMNSNGQSNFKVPKEGFYHIQLDTTKREGLTLYNYFGDYPLIKKADEMVYPLRFITSNQEYDDLIASANKKSSVDKFWLTATGNPERGREVVRKFYTRVQDANLYFGSYLEGWKTDRGMIYIIYGSPNVIYRTANAETWIYGEENNINSLSYSFTKLNNPFTDNDYSLERSVVYKQSWYTAVDIWRQGRTYLQD